MSNHAEDLDRVLEIAGELGAFFARAVAKIVHRAAWGDPDPQDRQVPLPRAAKLLGCAESTLRAAIARGDIKATRKGAKLLFFDRDEIERYRTRKDQ